MPLCVASTDWLGIAFALQLLAIEGEALLCG